MAKNTCINIVDLDGGIEATDGDVGVDLIELDIDDAHAVATVDE